MLGSLLPQFADWLHFFGLVTLEGALTGRMIVFGLNASALGFDCLWEDFRFKLIEGSREMSLLDCSFSLDFLLEENWTKFLYSF